MALDAKLLLLKRQFRKLGALLVDLRKRVSDDCPDAHHYLIERLNDAIPVVEGWHRKAYQGARQAVGALKHSQMHETRLALTRCDQAVSKLKSALSRDLAGKNRLRDLEDLSQRRARIWKAWMAEVLPTLRDIRQAMKVLHTILADCWRELAGQISTGIVINTVAVGKHVKSKASPSTIANH